MRQPSAKSRAVVVVLFSYDSRHCAAPASGARSARSAAASSRAPLRLQRNGSGMRGTFTAACFRFHARALSPGPREQTCRAFTSTRRGSATSGCRRAPSARRRRRVIEAPPPLTRVASRPQPSHVARVKVSFSFLFYLERRLFQRAALQARFRSRTSFLLSVVLTLCSESTVSWPLLPFQPDIIMRL